MILINYCCQTRWHGRRGLFRDMQRRRRVIEARYATRSCAWRFSGSKFAWQGLGRAAEIYYLTIGIHFALDTDRKTLEIFAMAVNGTQYLAG